MLLTMAGCAGGVDEAAESGKTTDEEAADKMETDETGIQVFIAASLNTVMTELADLYNEDHPEVKIIYNADSSGTLLTRSVKATSVTFSSLPHRSRWTTWRRTA